MNTTKPLLQDDIPSLDGLRGLAILLVLAYHYLHLFSFGWMGVDLFFVLSGFLITGKLIESWDRPGHIGRFYLSRILRIVPAYYLLLLAIFAVLPLIAPNYPGESFKALLHQQWTYWTFTVNILDAFHGWPANTILIHTWSLACEMQFYLVWPLLIYLFRRKLEKLPLLLVAFGLLALLFRLFGHYALPFHYVFRYVSLPSRIDAFSAGALLYLLMRNESVGKWQHWFWAMPALGLGGIVWIVVSSGQAWYFGFPDVSAWGPTCNAAIWFGLMGLTLTSSRNNWVLAISSRPMRLLGKYSYGIYLFHVPVLIVVAHMLKLRPQAQTFQLVLIAILLSLVLGVASYHLVEKPFLKMKPRR